MELKKGMYVKYTRGMINGYVPPRIAKIVDCSDNDLVAISNSQVILKSDVIKASDDLIDLIEVGDYVNGKRVVDKWEEPDWYGYFIKLEGETEIPTIRNIKSIVTKEQFDSVKYEVK